MFAVWAARCVRPPRPPGHRARAGRSHRARVSRPSRGRPAPCCSPPIRSASRSNEPWPRWPNGPPAWRSSAAWRRPPANRVATGSSSTAALHSDGAVGALLDASVPVTPVVSQGCRPIGDPLTVTRSERNVIYELAGQPALDRLMEVVEQLDADDRGRWRPTGCTSAWSSTSTGPSSVVATSSSGRPRRRPRGRRGGRRRRGRRSAPRCSSRSATPTRRTRTSGCSWRTGPGRAPWCSRATAGASHLFGVPDHDAELDQRGARRRRGRPACSAPASSAPSGAATSSTASPRRSPWSG